MLSPAPPYSVGTRSPSSPAFPRARIFSFGNSPLRSTESAFGRITSSATFSATRFHLPWLVFSARPSKFKKLGIGHLSSEPDHPPGGHSTLAKELRLAGIPGGNRNIISPAFRNHELQPTRESVEHGKLKAVRRRSDHCILRIQAAWFLPDTHIGRCREVESRECARSAPQEPVHFHRGLPSLAYALF